MANRLADATSPYLLQHKENPVDWREWGEAALAEAQATDRPILLSVGYAACHWCHVMAHESFEDARIAEVMNAHFVNIKVDREERPDVDQLYQHALALLGEQGGWPLTMFLTPEGQPFWGGTYFPPSPRFGRPSFEQVLLTLDKLWREDRSKIEGNRDSLNEALGRLATVADATKLPVDLPDQVAERLLGIVDREHGGFGDAPKFPQAPMLDLLWRRGLRRHDEAKVAAADDALVRMAKGGICDHVGGGFARYAVDRYWHVPHFEKMLYDNAQLLELYSEAGARTGRPFFRATAAGIVSWLLREMRLEHGFAASLDADSEGVEGKFYVWDRVEIDRLLGADSQAFCETFDVRPEGNWEGVNVLHRLGDKRIDQPDHEAKLVTWREALRRHRESRIRPARDDKILADWNGMMIATLAQAGQDLGRTEWIEAATAAFADVLRVLGPAENLGHSFHAGRRLDVGFLDDHAQLAKAACRLFAATGDTSYLATADALLAAADRRFRLDDGSYAPGADEGLLPIRSRWMIDGPTPSPLGSLATAHALMFHLTGEAAHGEAARSLIERYAGEIARNPAAYASLLGAKSWLDETVVMAVSGEPAATAPLLAAFEAARPAYSLQLAAKADSLPRGHPLVAAARAGNAAAITLCARGTCSLPLASPEAITAELSRLQA